MRQIHRPTFWRELRRILFFRRLQQTICIAPPPAFAGLDSRERDAYRNLEQNMNINIKKNFFAQRIIKIQIRLLRFNTLQNISSFVTFISKNHAIFQYYFQWIQKKTLPITICHYYQIHVSIFVSSFQIIRFICKLLKLS